MFENEENILKKYEPYIKKIIYKYSNCEYEKDDLFQECSIELLKSLGKYENKSSLKTYIYSICRNTIYKYIKYKKSKEKEYYCNPTDEEGEYTNVEDSINNNIFDTIKPILRKEEYDLIESYYRDDFNYITLAEECNMTRKQVEYKIKKILQKIRENLEEQE